MAYWNNWSPNEFSASSTAYQSSYRDYHEVDASYQLNSGLPHSYSNFNDFVGDDPYMVATSQHDMRHGSSNLTHIDQNLDEMDISTRLMLVRQMQEQAQLEGWCSFCGMTTHMVDTCPLLHDDRYRPKCYAKRTSHDGYQQSYNQPPYQHSNYHHPQPSYHTSYQPPSHYVGPNYLQPMENFQPQAEPESSQIEDMCRAIMQKLDDMSQSLKSSQASFQNWETQSSQIASSFEPQERCEAELEMIEREYAQRQDATMQNIQIPFTQMASDLDEINAQRVAELEVVEDMQSIVQEPSSQATYEEEGLEKENVPEFSSATSKEDDQPTKEIEEQPENSKEAEEEEQNGEYSELQVSLLYLHLSSILKPSLEDLELNSDLNSLPYEAESCAEEKEQELEEKEEEPKEDEEKEVECSKEVESMEQEKHVEKEEWLPPSPLSLLPSSPLPPSPLSSPLSPSLSSPLSLPPPHLPPSILVTNFASPLPPSSINLANFDECAEFDEVDECCDVRKNRDFVDLDSIEHIDFVFQDESNFNNKAKIRIAIGMGFIKMFIHLGLQMIFIFLLPLALHSTCFHFKTLKIQIYVKTCLPPTLIFDPG